MNTQRVKILNKTFQRIGFTKNESIILSILLKIKKAKVSEIIELSKLDKSSVYYVLVSLEKQNLVFQTNEKYNTEYYIRTKKDLFSFLNEKERNFKKNSLRIKNILSTLNFEKNIPEVIYFKGREGLIKAQNIILEGENYEILIYTNQKKERFIFSEKQHQNFIKKRIKHNIKAKVLTLNNKEGQTLKEKDEENLRKTKFFTGNFDFSAETYIFEGKILMLDFCDEIVGVMIKNKEMYEFQKQIFRNLWLTGN